MKIALAQLNYTIADIAGNTAKIRNSIARAKALNADVLVFSELAVCGYPPDDLLDYPHFIDRCREAVQLIASDCTGISVILGAPMENPEKSGRRLYNAACVLEDGKLQHVVYKTLLPNYDVFNESRYFEVNERFGCISIGGKRLAITICEDLWHETDRFAYLDNPLKELSLSGPELIINISASPYNGGKMKERLDVLQEQCRTYGLGMVYVNQVGVHTDLIFDGNSLLLDSQGRVLAQLPAFEEALAVFEPEQLQTPLPHVAAHAEQQDDELTEALVFGIRDFFAKSGFKTAVLGSSGGIDSALVQALASRALGPENVTALLMPSAFSSEGSVADAEQLCKNLGNPYHIVPIKAVYNAFQDTLSPLFRDLPFGLAQENMQARSRAVLLMAHSNQFGSILLNTSNKSEISVGYSTLYGDMCGSLSVIGDVFKTRVYRLAKRMNRHGELIPKAIIEKAPSAELRPDQKDSDSLPEYPVLDAILEGYIERHQGPEALVAAGFDAEVVKQVLGLVNRSEYKRFQAPPILRVSSKAFGRGRVIPLVSKW